MTGSPWLLPWVVFIIVAVCLAGVGAASVGLILWIDRSPSPRAKRIRSLFGVNDSNRPPAKRFFWVGEAARFRRHAAQEFARKRGASLEPTDAALLPKLQPFRAAQMQDSAVIGDVIRWTEDGQRITLFSYTFDDTDSTTTKLMLYVEGAGRRLPPFFLTGKTALHSLLGEPALDFAEDVAFSARYHLTGPDAAAIRKTFDNEVRAAFLTVPSCRVECANSAILFVDPEQTTLAGFESFVSESMLLLRALNRP